MATVLILMSETGGGHLASAQALQAALSDLYNDAIRVVTIDLWMRHTPWPINQMPKSYRFLATDTPQIYKLLWDLTEREQVIKPLMESIALLARRRVAEVIQETNPDLLVAVHPLLQEVPQQTLERMGRKVPLMTVVTDLGALHSTWFDRRVARCFVPTDVAYSQALYAGLSPSQLRQYGIPIRKEFAREPTPRDRLRRELGMAPDLPAVLLTGGGWGMGPVEAIARQVAARLARSADTGAGVGGQLVLICGRNEQLRRRLGRVDWPVPVIVNGFVSNIADWMSACDAIITKAGALTIAEAMACGLPIVLSGYVQGQEAGNVAYVVENGIGVYSQAPAQIAEVIARWFDPEADERLRLAERSRSCGRPRASYQIARDIAAFVLPEAAVPYANDVVS